MKKLSSIFVAAHLVTQVYCVAACAQADQRLQDRFEGRFTNWMRDYQVEKGVLVVKWGPNLVLERGYGGQDPAQRVLLASLSKAITGRCLVRARGWPDLKFDFDSKVGELLTSFFATFGEPADPRVKEVTVEQLLTHRAGFAGAPRDLMVPAALELLQRRKSPATAPLQELLAAVLTSPLETNPGERFRYSNIGYLMLGAIIEAVTGETYEEYCGKYIARSGRVESPTLDSEWRAFSSFGGWRLTGREYLDAIYTPRGNGYQARFGNACNTGTFAGREGADRTAECWLLRQWNAASSTSGDSHRRDGPGKIGVEYHGLGQNELAATEIWHRGWHTGSWGVAPNTVGMIAVEHESGLSWFVWFTPRPPQDARDRLFQTMLDAVDR